MFHPDTILWRADATARRFTYVCPDAESLLGYPVERWLETPDFLETILHPGDRRGGPQGERFEAEYRLLTAEGATLAVHEKAHLSGDEWIGAITPLTDFSRELDRTRRILRFQLEFTRGFSAASNLDQSLDMLLQKGCELFGFDMGAVWLSSEDKLLCRRIWPREGSPLEDSLQRSFHLGQGVLGRVWKESRAVWFEVLPDDFERWPAFRQGGPTSAFFLPIGETRSTPVGMIEFFSVEPRPADEVIIESARELGNQLNDYLNHRWAREAMIELENKFYMITKTLPDAVVMIDENDRIVYVNDAVERVFGHPARELLEQEMSMLMPESSRSGHSRGLARYLTTGEKALRWEGFDILALHRSGREFPVNISLGEHQARGERFITAIVRDITERHRFETELRSAREAALESARLKSQFLANISHEIRTPMNGVIGMVGLLLDTQLSEQQQDFAQTIRTSAQNLLAVVNDVLDFSKIEAGKLRLETVHFNLQTAIDEVVELMAHQVQKSGLEFHVLVDANVPEQLVGDPARLWQVLMNLVGNAIKFTEEGSITLRVTSSKGTGSKALIRFEIQDTGVGITPEQQARLFQPFSQLDGSNRRRHQGTGLGLVICSQLVQLMGGEIGLHSTPGQGSTFWFSIPFLKSEMNVEKELQKLQDKRCLIVDDQSANRLILAAQLERIGLAVEQASNAAKAREKLRQKAEPFDFMILDVHMPEEDGLTLARSLLSDPEQCQIPIILLSSFERMGELSRLHEEGISAVLRKPASSTQLANCLCRVLSPNLYLAATAPQELTSPEPLIEKSRLRLLIAEDNSINRKVLTLQLKKLGYQADSVSNGEEVTELLAQVPYDIILMDCQMPILDGYEATRIIRGRESDSQPVILALTANALEGEREKCLAAGMDDYLSKPVDVKLLDHILARWGSEALARKEVASQ